ncbi:hypothetical protein ACLOJK_014308 [Asimina triloba]
MFDECNKDVPVGLIDMHSCSLDSKIKMNLEAQVVERVTEVKKPAERKRQASSESKQNKSKKKKARDPNTPKRPPTAFFLFMDDFRKSYKEANPDSKSVSKVAKEGGEKWKSMTEEEKKPYLEKSAELKAEYEKVLEKFNAGNDDNEVVNLEEEVSDKEE